MRINETDKPLVFTRINTVNREKNILRILMKSTPSKNEMFWLGGFLKYVGYSEDEIFDIIDRFNTWDAYNSITTKLFVSWFFSKSAQKPDNPVTSKSQGAPTYSPDELIDLFLQKAKPFFPNKISNIKDMALWYYSRGFHVLPASKNVKLVPKGISWSAFQDVQPSFELIQRWDWSHGLILVGTQQHCFLDIDMKSKTHKDGFETFDENRLKGWCWERTKGGGYHVFGLGRFKLMKSEPVSIRGRGAYTVTAPTPGYVVMS